MVGKEELSGVEASTDNAIYNPSFELDLAGYFTSSNATTGGTAIVSDVDTLKQPGGHGNSRTIVLEVTQSNAGAGSKHYRVQVGGSAKTV